jgi:hypothetical protein
MNTETPIDSTPVEQAVVTRWSFYSDEAYNEKVAERRARDVAMVDALATLVAICADQNVPMPDSFTTTADGIRAVWSVQGVEQMATLRRAIGTPLPGRWVKETSEYGSLKLTLTDDGPLSLRIVTWGATCEKVQVGTKTETKTETVVEAETREVEVEVPVYEFRCPPINGVDDEDDR